MSFAEAQTMIAAQHDNVVAVYSAELEGTQPVIRMEFLADGSVADKYCGSPAAVGDAVRIMEDACRGVEHLHIRGILHRDIKPANLLIAPTGQIKVSDFGLACHLADTASAPPQMYLSHLPPESASQRNGITTCAGDIYAAGVTAYRLLNGDQLLQGIIRPGADPFEVIAKGQYPNRRRWLPHIHDQLRRAVNKAMHVEASKRYADARTFRRALENSRPRVSWWPTSPATGSGWEGVTVADGTTWRAVIEPKARCGFQFKVERRLVNKAWRQLRADRLDASSVDEITQHAHNVLSRIAVNGA